MGTRMRGCSFKLATTRYEFPVLLLTTILKAYRISVAISQNGPPYPMPSRFSASSGPSLRLLGSLSAWEDWLLRSGRGRSGV